MITNEIVVLFKNYTALNTLYNINRIDDDVKLIAEEIRASV